MTPEEFRIAGHQLIDWIADYREQIGSRPVAHLPQPGSIRAMLPERAPERGEPIARDAGEGGDEAGLDPRQRGAR